MAPSESKNQTIITNVRTEGDRNANNDPNYSGAKGIITKPEFSKLIRSQRCLIIASAFIARTLPGILAKQKKTLCHGGHL